MQTEIRTQLDALEDAVEVLHMHKVLTPEIYKAFWELIYAVEV